MKNKKGLKTFLLVVGLFALIIIIAIIGAGNTDKSVNALEDELEDVTDTNWEIEYISSKDNQGYYTVTIVDYEDFAALKLEFHYDNDEDCTGYWFEQGLMTNKEAVKVEEAISNFYDTVYE